MKTLSCPNPLKSFLRSAPVAALVAALLPAGALAAADTWTGQGPDAKWQTGQNWLGNTAPSGGDSLIFKGTAGLANTNTFIATTFSGITFTNSGAFVLWGNPLILGGDIVDCQIVTPQTINLRLDLNGSRTVNVTNGGSLVLNGVVTGPGFGLTNAGSGTLVLNGTNTFGGPVVVNAGTVVVSTDANLGAPPVSPTPRSLVLNFGSLRTTNSFTLSANRGIAVGPTNGSGFGIIDIGTGQGPGATANVTYNGSIANNGLNATGSLVKLSFATLTLGASNSYSGKTQISNGIVALDFSAATAPPANILNPVTSLFLGGANSGAGTTNFSELIVNPKASGANAQTFSSTKVIAGASLVRVNSNGVGSATVSLGNLDHDAGGTLTAVLPTLIGGNGTITTTATNLNGILGGWATVSSGQIQPTAFGVPIGTNYACVDANSNIVSFTNFLVYTGGNLAGHMGSATNLLITTNSSVGTAAFVVTLDAISANSTNDVNTVTLLNLPTVTTFTFGTNTLRLGKFGGILKQDNGSPVLYFGGFSTTTQTGNGTAGSQSVGTLTAGGPTYNTPGEIVVTENGSSQSSGNVKFECRIADNGPLGTVTFIKAGSSSIKLDGHNTHSGGCYLLQGRVQFSGSETGTANVGDACGTGPVYLFPGCYVLFSGSAINTNSWFVAGIGTAAEPAGLSRGARDTTFTGPWTLLGDAVIPAGRFMGGITGPYNLTFGVPGVSTSTSGVTLGGTNSWTGNTTLAANYTTPSTQVFVVCSNDNVIPHGFGFGNLIFDGGPSASGAVYGLDLHSCNETINGISHARDVAGNRLAQGFIINSVANSTSTITMGDNNQSGVFEGQICDAGTNGAHTSVTALTKIGSGILTLTGTNMYSGDTTISGGTLALGTFGIDSGSMTNSRNIRVSGATLDISGVSKTAPFWSTNSVALTNGTLIGNTDPRGILNLSMTNSALTVVVNPSVTNVYAANLTTGGSVNVVNILGVGGIQGYPTQFMVLSYSGAIGGAGGNFALGSVPSPTTQGYITNDTSVNGIVLVLTNGPKALTWVGNDPLAPGSWDLGASTNWFAFGISANKFPFFNADSVVFDESASTKNVNFTSGLLPGAVVFSNSVSTYTLSGSGALGGLMTLDKENAGIVILAETGGDGFSGGITVNGGTVILAADNGISGGASVVSGATLQVGNNGGAGNLPAGTIANDGSLVFNRGADFTVNSVLAGAGSVTKNNNDTVTLSAANSFTGPFAIAHGTVRVDANRALGTTDGTATVSSGATLDVGAPTLGANNLTLGLKPVTVSGVGVGGNGAIVNSTLSDQQHALSVVNLAADTTFGGAGRWDISGTNATLTTSGTCNLTKISTNQVSLVGVSPISGGLNNIDVQAGVLSLETTSDSPGAPAGTITVRAGARLQLNNLAATLDKNVVLIGDGTNTTLTSTGTNHITSSAGQSVSLSGACSLNVGGLSLTIGSPVSGSGASLEKHGSASLILSGSAITYTGPTTVTNGTLLVDGPKTGGGGLTAFDGTTLGGSGSINEPVTVYGTLSPGDPASANPVPLGLTNTLVLSNSTCIFELGTTTLVPYDQVLGVTDLTFQGSNTFQINPVAFLNAGDVFTLFQYTGTRTLDTNKLGIVAKTGFSFSLVPPETTPGLIQVHVDLAEGNCLWTGGDSGHNGPTAWDNNFSKNWIRNNIANSIYTNLDFVSFSDAAPGPVKLIGDLSPSGIGMTNNSDYFFGGPGRLTGSGNLDKEGFGSLYITNSGFNDFTGPVTVELDGAQPAGLLQFGDGGTNGNIGSGIITNNGYLVFNRSDTTLITNRIFGSNIGFITNQGSGTLTLSGANGHSNLVTVAHGTIQLGNNSALGSTNVGTLIATGATLDLGSNNVNVGLEPITVSGWGVNSNGAIINSSGNPAFSQANIANVTMMDDTAFGGSGRLDFRSSSTSQTNATLSTQSQALKLIKVGTNSFYLTGVQVDSALGDIEVRAGFLGIEATTTSLGDSATHQVAVFSNCTLNFHNISNVLDKPVVMHDGAIIGSTSGSNAYYGPITTLGKATFDISSSFLILPILTNAPGAVGDLVKNSGSTLILTGAVAYAGNTIINNGRLVLGSASPIPNSTLYDLGTNGTLDISTAGGTLTRNSGQTIQGGGQLWGSLVVNSSATVSVGESNIVDTMLVTNQVTLNAGSTTLMKLNVSNTNLSDRLVASNSLALGGTLQVTNIGPLLLSGDTFTLFSSPALSLSIAVGQLPPLWPGLSWNTSSLNSAGTISVTGTLLPPTITSASASQGTNFIVKGGGGLAGATCILLGSTNVTTPLTNWVALQTNVFDGSGNFSFTNIISGPKSFYLLQVPAN